MPVTEVKLTHHAPYAAGQPFGDAGTYERIDGVITFAVEPDHAANGTIVDLKLAPRDSKGRVQFRSDFVLLLPQSAERGNGALIVDVVNRGRKRVVSTFNRAPGTAGDTWEMDPGDGFLFRHGFSVVSIGWQWDVYRSDALLGLEAPCAEIEGKPVKGLSCVEIRPNVLERTRLLANRNRQPYPAVDPDDPAATLTVRDWEDGPDTVIPRGRWVFGREAEGEIVPSREHIHFPDGFQAGRIYHIVYTAEGAPIAGGGLLAVREVATWLRHPSALNPAENGYERVYGYGVSQTGRLLRHFLYAGLNLDEEGRSVFDGLLPHVAGGRRGEFNHRFAQPSQQSAPGFGQLFPFADDPITDPLTKQTDGLLSRVRGLQSAPKIIYTNSSAEYWRGDGSFPHIGPDGESDLAGAAESRIYHFSGTQHGAGSLPQSSGPGPDGSAGRYPSNVVDYRPLLRAALINLDRWVREGIEPPPSRHPRLADGTAVERREVLAAFPKVPDFERPDPERLWVVREVDLGPEADLGIGRYPVQEGCTYPCVVSAIDGDGNEVAGVQLPDLIVPVGTHAGWNPRAPESDAPEQIVPMQGFSLFFPPTKAAREASGDPRRALDERYRSREAYLEQAGEAARKLVEGGYLLEEDVDLVVSACEDRYHAAIGR